MILILTAPDRDYHADYLAHGFCALLGAQHVVDFPRKESLHWQDAPVMDCDLDLATRDMSESEVAQGIRDGSFDLIVIPTLRNPIPRLLYRWREVLRRSADRIVFVDGEDHEINLERLITEHLGFRPAASFKRELPLGAIWAQPLPFGYPEERICEVDTERAGLAYAVEIWPWAKGKTRDQVAHLLLGDPRATVSCGRDGLGRLSVPDYHALNRRSLVAISPAGQGWHTNRHFDIVADGCCPVLEHPWMTFPNGFSDGVECRYFRNAFEAVDLAHELLDDESVARQIAKAAQASLRQYHTTKVRALTVWKAIHGREPRAGGG